MKVNNIDNRLAEMQELEEIERIEEEAGIKTSPKVETRESMSGSFMSESVYGKLNSPQARRRRAMSSLPWSNKAYLRTNSDSCATETSRPWHQYSSTSLPYFTDARLFKPILTLLRRSTLIFHLALLSLLRWIPR